MRLSRWWRCSSKAITKASIAQVDSINAIYTRLVDSPALSSSDVATLSTELLPYLPGNTISLAQKYDVLRVLWRQSIRHEGVWERCIWDILKADLPSFGRASSVPESQHDGVVLSHFAHCTASTFRMMADLRFTSDHQMLALALGRCTEVSPALTHSGVAEVYLGLSVLNREYFSLAQTALHETEVTEGFRMKEFYERDSLSEEQLIQQPNMIDVLCGHLEGQLQFLAEDAYALDYNTSGSKEGPRALVESTASRCAAFASIMQALSIVGVLSPQSFAALVQLAQGLPTVGPAQLATMLQHALKTRQRVADALDYEETYEAQEGRDQLVQCLLMKLSSCPGLTAALKGNPAMVLQIRRMFEDAPVLAEHAPLLWDTVRCIRVAHKHSCIKSTDSGRLGGKLFAKEFGVKTKRISVDLSEAEKFVPPEFKTWRSPQHSARGGHKPSTRMPRVAAFGTRRISRNYLRQKKKKFMRPA